MPPKFQLQITVQPEEEPGESSDQSRSLSLNGSVRINPSGTLICLTNSYNAVMFSPEGMSKKDTGTHYMISEHDIRVTKRLGAGASSAVFKGLLLRENKFVAIKGTSVLERDTRQQMLNDIKGLIDTPNLPGLIQFHGAFHVQGSGQISIVLEYMDAGSLADVLLKVGRIPEDVLSKLAAKILVGLSYLHKHKKLVHRDIKPANILINLEGEPRITDFGISAFIDSTLAVCHTFLGTVTYMSPERINAHTYGTMADIWSIGLVFLECAIGKYPYNASVGPLQLMMEILNEEVPIPKDASISPEFRDFVSQCMQKDAADRPSADVLLNHPYIQKYAAAQVDLQAFMQCQYDPQNKLDDVTIIVIWNNYAVRGADANSLRRDAASFYAKNSTYIHEGEKFYGRDAIIQKLVDLAEKRPGHRVEYSVQQLDCQPLGTDGSIIAHVQGQRQQLPNLAAGFIGSTTTFQECFILAPIQDDKYFISSQAFRIIR